MSHTSETRVIRFGSFETNLDSWELRKHGLKVKLPNHSFVVLACLLEKPGELVTREELRAKIWPETTHVDFDNSLNTTIRHVREALGDSARNPRFVDTVRGRGYRFVAPVEVVAGANTKKTERRRWAPIGFAVTAAAAAALAMLAWFPFANPRASEESWAPKLSPLTSYVGAEGHPSFSPDGSRVAFHWNGPEMGSFDI
jgi:DNA-binding winged helix-turn-helix (wHTH) protein